MSMIDTVKRNKLAVILAVALLFWIGKDVLLSSGVLFGSTSYPRPYTSTDSLSLPITGRSMGSTTKSGPYVNMPVRTEAAPTTSAVRMVVQDTSMSMVVKSVEQTLQQIESVATQYGGYMVNTSLSKPESAASGYISLRVPTVKRPQVLTSIKALGVKVVSESVSGMDVTDQYTDIQTRLDELETTKAKYQGILDKAISVPEILEVTREIQNIQAEIDSLKGQQQYLAKTAELTLITVNLSTDELALPYAPEKSWDAQVIAKQAIRSLVGTLRSLGSLIIWAMVYAPIWIVILVGYWLWKRRGHAPTKI